MPEIRALFIGCTLKPSPEKSNSEELARILMDALQEDGVEAEFIRAVDHEIKPGVESDMGEGDEWPAIREKIVASQILVIVTPTWLGRPSSVAQRILERMDAMISEQDDDGRPIAYNRVAGVVVAGNEDGAHHVISEISGALSDIGYTIPGQAWTYWNRGPGPGKDFLDTKEGHPWAESTGKAAASNLVAAARALAENPIPAPPS
jgi:multimeric flavodoxin WrbA